MSNLLEASNENQHVETLAMVTAGTKCSSVYNLVRGSSAPLCICKFSKGPKFSTVGKADNGQSQVS